MGGALTGGDLIENKTFVVGPDAPFATAQGNALGKSRKE